eukprot:CAMPEP_0185801552 /NCGR_PEP_ID=MMETSP1322-20130828/1490_1 /TAXON_ID=265543 /ORGANISM="Minutocellus polymorphus, Strain RCC2270" /LENGTH=871 /DNA_ID=CAMNT_0028497251 /DNA_START=254 /DNA_END=2869 /DNA_ORIENTATION=-
MPLLADDSGEEVSPPVPPLASEESAPDVSLTETELLNSVADRVLDAGGAAPTAQPTPTDWKILTVAKLKDELRSRGLKVGGKKKELVRRLAEDDASRAAAAAAASAASADDAAAAPANPSTFDEVWEQQQQQAANASVAESASVAAGSVVGSVAGTTAAAANDDETATSEISGTAASIAAGKVSPLLAVDSDQDDEDEESAYSLGPPAPPPRSRDTSKEEDEEIDESASAYTAATTGVAAVAAAVAVGGTAADTSAAAGVSSEEMSQRDATTEIADGADGFEDIEEGRAGVSMANQTCTSESAYGAAYGDDADADFVDEDEEENKPPQSKEEAVAKNGTGGGRCGGKRTKVVLAVLGVIVAAAIAIGACIGAGVINFGDGSSSNAPKQAGSDGSGDLTLEPTVSPTDRPTVKPGTPTVSPTARPTATPTLPPVAATRYEAGADFDVAAALSGPDAVSTEGTAQREALKWLVDADPLRLTTDAAAAAARPGLTLVDSDKFLQRYALTAVIFSLTDGGEQESGGSEMGLDIKDEEVVAVVEEEEVEDVEVMVDDKEAEKAAKEAEKAAKQKANENPEDTAVGLWQAPFPAGGDRQRRIMAAELLPAGIDECDLKFIGCNQEGKITKINFRKMGLGGILSPEISQFWQTLIVLDLSDNQIEGTIPDSIYDMYWLEALYLKSNRFTGTISPKIGQLTSLVNFYAGQNILKGGVPLGFGQCKNLRNLSLYKNNLSGPIPDWSTLNGLHYLDLGFNEMTGTLPESLVKHRILRLLYLNNNQFTGTIPDSYPTIGNRKLKEIHLNNNQLTGPIPSDWSNGWDFQKHLLAIRVENNDLDGEFDKSICELDVRSGRAELVELGADCDNCSCKLCEDSCTK